MILKLLGAALVMSATVLSGLYYGSFESYRVSDLMQMKKALAILKAEIVFSMTPLPEAFANIAGHTQEPIGGIFRMLAEQLAADRRVGVTGIWERCIKAQARNTYFNNDDLSALMSFGRTLGYLDEDMQASGIAVAIGYIDSAVASLGETKAKNKRLFGSLGVLSGLLTVVIFI